MNATTINFENGSQKISAVLTTPSELTNRIIILAHGGPGGNKQGPSNIFAYLAEELAKEGFASLRFDFRGSGDSEGDFIDMTIQAEASDLQVALNFVLSQGYQQVGLVGESLGGTVAILGYDDRYKAIALWFPAIYLMQTSLTEFLSEEKLAELAKKGYISEGSMRIGKPFINEFQQIDIESLLKKVKCPILLIHGDQDHEVPVDQSVKAFELLKVPKQLEIIKGGDHGLRKPDEQRTTINMTVSWFKSHLS